MDTIEEALENSAAMLLVLSANSVESRHVADEWHYFLEEDKPVVPVLYQECRVPYQLRRIQYVDFTVDGYEHALHRLESELRAALG